MKPFEHGGNIHPYSDLITMDFSANINPFGIPESVKQAMIQAVEQCIHYPEPYAQTLCTALGRTYHRKPEEFFCGNGAAEIFYRLTQVLRPKRALLLAPTFSEYEAALIQTECEIVFHTLKREQNFAVTDDFLQDLQQQIDICFLCTPNNPTGCLIDEKRMQSIIEICKRREIWLIVDECFLDFVCGQPSVLSYLDDFSRLVVVRAFTKMYAIPGVRLGWCVSSNLSLIKHLKSAGQPWNTSSIAQACGLTALSIPDYAKQTAIQIQTLRHWLFHALQTLGFTVWKGQANYLLFYTSDITLHEALLQRGVLIRDCSNYRGLGAGFYRVAVRTQAENEKLIQIIREVCQTWRK